MHRVEYLRDALVLVTAAGTVTAAWTQRGGPIEELFVGFSLATFAGLARATTARFDGYRGASLIAELMTRLVASWFVGLCFWFLLLERAPFGVRVVAGGFAALFAVEVIDSMRGRIDWFLDRTLTVKDRDQ